MTTENDYYKHMKDFIEYFEYIINKYCQKNVEIHLNTIKEYKELFEKNKFGEIEERSNIIHQHLYRKENINFINYWHYNRCKECNLPIPM
jgi:DNA-binding transcriptional regulator GbsR (MarR family)